MLKMEDSVQKKAFDDTEREQHKKQQRMCNSLGALLSGLGSGGPKPSCNDSDAGQTSKAQNSTGQQNKGAIPPTQVENNKSNFGDMPGNAASAKSEFGWSAASCSMGFTSSDMGASSDTNNSKPNDSDGADRKDSAEKDRLQDTMPQEFQCWTETRMLNDDHDSEWFDYENKKLAELYGEDIITVKYTDQGGLSYYCELCFATMNAKKPLEMHCSGMKHLKKKDTYDKNKASGKENPLVERRKIMESSEKALPPKGSSHNKRSDGGRQEHEKTRGRSPQGRPRSSLGRSRSPLGRSRSPLGRSRSPPGRSRSGLGRSRSPTGYGRDSYGRGRSNPYASDRERYPYPRSNDRDPYGRERDRFDRADRSDPYYDAYRRYPGDRRDERYCADERSRYGGDYRDIPRSQDGSRHPDDRLPYDDRRRYDEDYAYRSRDYSSQSRLPDDQLSRDASDSYLARSRYDSLDRPHTSGSLPRRPDDRSPYASAAENRLGRLPSPPPAQPPPPVISAKPSPPVLSANSMDDYQNLSSGPAASLLSKLAQCMVKNEYDAELASNVIDLLLKSLKQYNEKIGEKSVAELMEQAEIKLGTAKAIRKVNKSTAPLSVAAVNPVSIAMETLRRAAAEKIPELANAGPPVYKYF